MTTNQRWPNQDRAFIISAVAAEALHREALCSGSNMRAVFRRRAYDVAHGKAQVFNLSGAALNRTLTVGVNDAIYAKLLDIAQRKGLPAGVVGELVASAVLQDAEKN